MKSKANKIKLTSFVICLFVAMIGYSQTTYLKITKSNKTNDYEMYPPGTKFELKNAHGYIVFKNSENPGFIDITEAHTLYVYPSWKTTADVLELTEGRVEKVLKKVTNLEKHEEEIIQSNDVTAKYTVSDSKDLEGQKNLMFKLSNGIRFKYTDGKYNAYLNNEENYLNINNKYLIESEMGTLKLSFNPNNGDTWWVFEPIEKQKH